MPDLVFTQLSHYAVKSQRRPGFTFYMKFYREAGRGSTHDIEVYSVAFVVFADFDIAHKNLLD